MSLTASDKGGGDFEMLDEGTFMARCFMVVDLGTQESKWGAKEKVLISLEFPTELMKEGENEGKPFVLSGFYTNSLHEKSTLRPLLEAWRGRSFTKEELEGFDIGNIVGVPAMVGIVHNEKDGKTYCNISTLVKPMKGSVCPEAINKPIVFEMSTDNFNQATFDCLPEWIQSKIQDSLEYKGMGVTMESKATEGTDFGGQDIPESNTPF